MRKFDTFLLHDEWEMLECRLIEYQDVVDHHVAVMSDLTFAGQPTGVTFPADRFAPWKDRLTIVRAYLDPNVTSWQREHAAREWARRGLKTLRVEKFDLVLHSDVDEFPAPAAIAALDGPARFLPALHYWCVDWRSPYDLFVTVAMPYRLITSFYWMREERNAETWPVVTGGHAFSWVGTREWRHKKLRSFSHTELVEEWEPMIDGCVRDGTFPDGAGGAATLIPVDVDETWPRWIREGNAPADWFRER